MSNHLRKQETISNTSFLVSLFRVAISVTPIFVRESSNKEARNVKKTGIQNDKKKMNRFPTHVVLLVPYASLVSQLYFTENTTNKEL